MVTRPRRRIEAHPIDDNEPVCSGCPFGYSEQTEQAQNYGCLPTPIEMIKTYVIDRRTLSCHSNEKIPCRGLTASLAKAGITLATRDRPIWTHSEWYRGNK